MRQSRRQDARVAKQTAERWAAIVAEAEQAGVPHAQVAARHRVSLPALKYHLYKTRRANANRGQPRPPRLLPVQTAFEPTERAMLQAEVGAVRLRFPEGCDPTYVAALLSELRKAAC